MAQKASSWKEKEYHSLCYRSKMLLRLLLLFQKKQHVVAVVVKLDCFAVLESPLSRHDPCLQLQLRMTLIGWQGDFEWLKTVFLLKHLLLFLLFIIHFGVRIDTLKVLVANYLNSTICWQTHVITFLDKELPYTVVCYFPSIIQ